MPDEWMLLPVHHPVLLEKGVGGEDREGGFIQSRPYSPLPDDRAKPPFGD